MIATYKHVLVPTDGSGLAQATDAQATDIAKEIGAHITLATISRPFHPSIVEPMRVRDALDAYDRQAEISAAEILGSASAAAKVVGVNCNTVHVRHETAYAAIIGIAEQEGCNLIVMGLNRQHGLSAILHESGAVLIIKHCTVPMLIL